MPKTRRLEWLLSSAAILVATFGQTSLLSFAEDLPMPPDESLTAPLEALPTIEGEEIDASSELAEASEGSPTETSSAPPATQSESFFAATRRGYQYAKPEWASALTFSGNAFSSPFLSLDSRYLRSVRFQIEYQPRLLQALGVFGIGASASVYPYSTMGDVLMNVNQIWSYGGQVRYQGKFLREQIVVPYVGFAIERLGYNLGTISGRNVSLSGPFFGAMLLLNPFEPDAAGEAFIASGISRSYLVAELRSASGSDSNVNLTSSALSFGFRVEF